MHISVHILEANIDGSNVAVPPGYRGAELSSVVSSIYK